MKYLVLLFCLFSWTAPLAAADATPEMDDATVDAILEKEGEPPSMVIFIMRAYRFYDDVRSTIVSWWEAAKEFFSSLWSNTGGVVHKKVKRLVKGKKEHSLVKELAASAVSRVKKFQATYTEKEIPDDLKRIASVLDRLEEDFKKIKKKLKKEKDQKQRKLLIKALHNIDEATDDHLDKEEPILSKHQRDSFFTKDSKIFRFVQDLQGRAFVRAMVE